MKIKSFLISLALGANTVFAQDINMNSLPLPYPIGITATNYTHSIMRLEGTKLYVPTSNGIYYLDINDSSSDWSLQGFEWENLIECVHKGDEWLAITRNSNTELLLRSSDGGKTFVDDTPYTLFVESRYRTSNRLCQDPNNADVVYLLSAYAGILKSSDFGKTWKKMTDVLFFNHTYCGFEIHPLNSDIILEHGENMAMKPSIMISYNGGNDWIHTGYPTYDITLPYSAEYSENCIHDMAFHPTDINTWVFGGEGVIAKSTDCGKTWSHKAESWGYHYMTLFDNQDPNIIYSVGVNDGGSWRYGYCFYVSTDCGDTWDCVYTHTFDNTSSWANDHIPFYNDIKQTDDCLIILAPDELFFVKKSELLSSTNIQSIKTHAKSKVNNVYTTNGILRMRNANNEDLSKLPSGVYINNGKKIVSPK